VKLIVLAAASRSLAALSQSTAPASMIGAAGGLAAAFFVAASLGAAVPAGGADCASRSG